MRQKNTSLWLYRGAIGQQRGDYLLKYTKAQERAGKVCYSCILLAFAHGEGKREKEHGPSGGRVSAYAWA
ncbi:hypothetical protein SOASR031_22180 [Leminorella grimontii]|nr:hypothetical protein SOASR031_22180 [Leminorella grimontii]